MSVDKRRWHALLWLGAALFVGCAPSSSDTGDAWNVEDFGLGGPNVILPSAAWTDSGLFVLNAHTPNSTVEAAFWSDGTVDQLSLSGLEWRGEYVAGWDGESVHVWGGLERPLLGEVDPTSPTWTEQPIESRMSGSVLWNGDVFIAWTGGGLQVLDPNSGSLDYIDGFPLAGRIKPALAWTGTGVFVWGGCSGSQCDDLYTGSDEFVDGAFYDWNTQTWSVLPESPLTPRDGAVAAWNGAMVVVLGGDAGHDTESGGAAYDLIDGAWEELPASPLRLPRKGHSVTAIDHGRIAVWGGHGVVEPIDIEAGEYDLNPYNTGAVLTADLRWNEMSASPLSPRDRHAAAWTGSELLIVGGCCGINGDGIWKPPVEGQDELPSDGSAGE